MTDEQVLTVTPSNHFQGTDSITQVANIMSRKLKTVIVVVIIINHSKLPGKHEINELQKTTIFGTANTLQKVVM
jgi:hypothetical protein